MVEVESSSDPDRQEAELASATIAWEVSREAIELMSHEELVQEVINLNEKTRRLYEAAMLQVLAEQTGQPVKADDINHILNPEQL